MDAEIKVTETFYDGAFAVKVESDKMATDYKVIKRPGNPTMWHIEPTKGILPEQLRGRYTTPAKAVDDLSRYLKTAKVSKTVERDLKYQRSKAQKEARVVAASKSDDQEYVQ